MTPEEAGEIILAGPQWETCPDGCSYGRVAVDSFITPPEGAILFGVEVAREPPLMRWVRCTRCAGTSQVTPQAYIDACAQLGRLLPQYPPHWSPTLSAYILGGK